MAAPPEPPSRGSRLPVGRAQDKRAPSEGPPAAPPQQKRSRTGLGAPLGTLGRDAAAGENDGPREAASVAAAPRAGSVPSTSSKGASKRPPWDLRGQLRDLRKALGQAEERLQGLESEKRELESSNQQLRERLQRESPESSRCTQLPGAAAELGPGGGPGGRGAAAAAREGRGPGPGTGAGGSAGERQGAAAADAAAAAGAAGGDDGAARARGLAAGHAGGVRGAHPPAGDGDPGAPDRRPSPLWRAQLQKIRESREQAVRKTSTNQHGPVWSS
ncbi:uncharacterized protein LOC141728025 isoform X1 [Zonotrichia albicollis]|uniref:uncharacterized protein LOC141728025 isoform X1 n=1 Tax=Zonotrichia albicollis TaxID=44394 RepID=UPI003D80C10D